MTLNKRIFNSALVLLFITIKSYGQGVNPCYLPDPNGRARECNIKYDHMLLDVRFEPEKGKVIGKVTYKFHPLRKTVDSIWLDAPGINIKKVSCTQFAITDIKGFKQEEIEVAYKTNNEGVSIFPKKTLTWYPNYALEIEYEATPKKGIYFIGWDDSTNRSRKQIWTQGEGVDNRYWIPAFDEFNTKLTTELVVHMPAKYKVLGNGTFLGKTDDKDGNLRWHYKMLHPHAFYLTMLGIGDYNIASSKSTNGVQLNNWYYPDQPERLEPTYRYTAQIMDILEKETGVPYGWESYSQIPVQNFLYGAMENTTATIFGDFFCVDKRSYLDRNYVGVNAHEMAHQWFGDIVTARNPRDMWLQESFATYYGKMALKGIYGEEQFQWSYRGEMNSAIAAGKENDFPVMHTAGGSSRIYPKGSFVLGMLKYVVGEAEYNKAVQYYLQKHKYGMVDTHDFYQAFHDVLGVNLDWFFDEWIYRGGEPVYKVSYNILSDKSTQIVVEQTHKLSATVGLFKMPFVFEVHYKDGSIASTKEVIEKQQQVVNIPNKGGKEIDFVLFDPASKVLKTVEFEKKFEELEAQALRAANMLDRYDAVLAMKSTEVDKKRDLLVKIYNREKYFAIKSEVLNQLVGDEKSASLFNNAMTDKDVEVRLSALTNTKTITAQNQNGVEKLLTDSSYRIVEAALVKLCDSKPEKTEDYLKATDNTFGLSNTVRIAWLKIAYQGKGLKIISQEKVIKELVDYTSPAFEFRTRGNAFQALKAINYLDEKSAHGMMDAVCSNNSRLAGPATEVMGYFKSQDGYKKQLIKYMNSRKWTDAQKEILKKQLL
ncbi:MAG: M1 family metallopeptidase [Bacteroidetes bacterium]|nr:M1 family metallopeptidase [Bacteroidota bacterium]